MTATCSVFVATSLDGCIAREDGRIDWLERANAVVPPGEDCGYREFFDSVDALVMGRGTFDLAVTFDPWPYGGKRVVVMTHAPARLAIPPALAAKSYEALVDPKFGLSPDAKLDVEGLRAVLAIRAEFTGLNDGVAPPIDRYVEPGPWERAMARLR